MGVWIFSRIARTLALLLPRLGASVDGAAASVERSRDLPDTGLCERVDAAELRERSRWKREDWLRWLLTGRRPDPVPSYLGLVEDPDPERYGICCSGGGIRSAAFNLGALQALQQRGVLQEASYLSAVSGGSYIAAAFAMVAKTGGPDDSDPELVTDEHPPFEPGSPEEQYLRNRSSYLAPGVSGKLGVVGRIIIGLLVNLLVLGSLLFVSGWIAGWAYGMLHEGLREPVILAGGRADFVATVLPYALACAAVVGTGVVLAIMGSLVRPRRAWIVPALETWGSRLFALGALGALLLALVPETVEWARDIGSAGPRGAPAEVVADDYLAQRDPGWLALLGGGSAVSVLLSVLVQLRARFADVPGPARNAVSGALRRVGPRLRTASVYLAATLAGPLLFAAVLIVAMTASLAQAPGATGWWMVVGLVGLVAAPLYAFADLTTWSLHPFYKRRLCSAFALKRVREDGKVVARERDFQRLVPLSQSAVEPGPGPEQKRKWPLLLVCAAANVSDAGATPPGRGVSSFTFSANAIGGPLVGAMPTSEYERKLGDFRRDFTLPAAVAMSGAAVSPSMGKATRRAFTFLLALANVRLGVWLPNPRRADDLARAEGPPAMPSKLFRRPRPSYLFRELLGRNQINARFLYVTDGGHYENLGLVELLRRGCVDAFCLDASGGSSLQALGDAIALARSELGVEVDFAPAELAKLKRDEQGTADDTSAVGTISYPNGQTGRLVYTRSVLTTAAPWDVQAYHEVDPAFPHDSTSDQMYTDQRFEAYRALGYRAGLRALQRMHEAPAEGHADGRRSPHRLARHSLVASHS